DGELEGERRAATGAVLQPDLTAVRLHDALGDREAETRPTVLPPTAVPESIEDVRHVLFGHTGAGVFDGNHDRTRARAGAQRDRAPCRGELDRVPDEVGEHLEDAVAIAADRAEPLDGDAL